MGRKKYLNLGLVILLLGIVSGIVFRIGRFRPKEASTHIIPITQNTTIGAACDTLRLDGIEDPFGVAVRGSASSGLGAGVSAGVGAGARGDRIENSEPGTGMAFESLDSRGGVLPWRGDAGEREVAVKEDEPRGMLRRRGSLTILYDDGRQESVPDTGGWLRYQAQLAGSRTWMSLAPGAKMTGP